MRYLGRRLVHSWWCKAFLIVCVFFGCWNLLESLSSEDLRRTYNRLFTAREDWTKPDRVKLEALPSCSLRNNIMEENNLKTSFDFSVPLWQWRDSISLPLWQKLQYGTLPYGWKNQSYYEIEKTLALLSHPSNNRLFERREPNKCVRCAVVGNGGILNGSNQGEAIDKHDYVFRVNGAIIKGFEKDVGTKTSFYGFTTNSMKNSLIGYYEDGFHQVPQGKGIQYILIPAELRDYLMVAAAIKGVRVPYGPDEGDSPFEYFGNDLEAYQFKMIHPAFVHYVTQRFLNSYQLYEYADVYMPSTGAMMLLIALHSCDQVSAFGFITDNFQQFSDHYYEREYKPLIFYANHDIQMEGEFWKKLHNHKVMWLYQR